jgi:hypothetical protein
MPEMLQSIAVAIASLCSSSFQVGTFEKIQCQDYVVSCVLNKTKVADDRSYQDRMILICYQKYRLK